MRHTILCKFKNRMSRMNRIKCYTVVDRCAAVINCIKCNVSRCVVMQYMLYVSYGHVRTRRKQLVHINRFTITVKSLIYGDVTWQ